MAARVLDGKRIRDEIKAELVGKVRALKAAGITPGLAAVLVDQASVSHAEPAAVDCPRRRDGEEEERRDRSLHADASSIRACHTASYETSTFSK